MNFIIKDPDNRTLAATNYIYEAKEFAERMTGYQERSTWSHEGQLHIEGRATGWRIFRNLRLVTMGVPV